MAGEGVGGGHAGGDGWGRGEGGPIFFLNYFHYRTFLKNMNLFENVLGDFTVSKGHGHPLVIYNFIMWAETLKTNI
jgi:hypothetical protein